MMGCGRHEEDERDRGRHERAVVDVALNVVEIPELLREADREQEAEQDLGAGDERPQLLQELAVLALEPGLRVLPALFLSDVRVAGIGHAATPTVRLNAAA